MKRTLLTMATGLAIGLSSSMAMAESTKMTLSSWLPAGHPIVANMIQPWIDNVKEATEGRVEIKILAKGLGHPKVHYDLARDGTADVTYSVHGYTPGRFLMTKAVELPFMGDSAEALSVAYWRVHQSHLAKAKEHKDVKLLGVFSHGPGAIHNSKKDIKSAADIKSMKIRVGGGIVSEVAKSLETTPLLKPASKNYELLSHGVADGTFLPTESIPSFKITDLVKHTTLIPGGLYNTSFFLVMNKDRFAGLSEADQAAIDKVSGEAFAKLAGKAWDVADQVGIDAIKANGNSLTTADEAFIADIKARTAHLEKEWVEEVAEKGVDGAAALAELRKIVTEYESD
ncbi:TRAP transporter substrate-binding protein [Leucothrix pacifica]|uniref:ABC transporter substrate-binding protein n=1 Tax=Leucothrix pacifica TaxID=1247513 RepID=A0A317CQK4_9GAMM|nr:TRAP transporter substrate-binding protein [Leucothrix pacifica]PWR00665.1 ABC transporter substrate-binding protein [Leucothrix pacifica]